MLICCITGPDLETAKRQIQEANQLCDGIELGEDFLSLEPHAKNEVMINAKCQKSKIEISTYHNFDETPQDLEAILKDLPLGDVYKIACMANSTCDALRMLNFSKKHPNVIGLCMGPLGQITRILAPVVSNPYNFTHVDSPAAPGQLSAQKLIETYNYRSLSPSTKVYGLIGNPISHSKSHFTHNAFFKKENIDAVYVKMSLQEEEIPEFFKLAKEFGICGLSVTRPFKEKLFNEIDESDQIAQEIGAVNTLTFENEKIYAENTDAKAALDAIEATGAVQGKKCVVLGEGGSSKAICYEAKKRGANVTILSRRLKNLDKVPFYDILINTTPLPVPIALNALLPQKVVMDITVNHRESPFMQKAKGLGCELVYGEDMFERQALGQFKSWFKLAHNASL